MAEKSQNDDNDVQASMIRGKQPYADFLGTTELKTEKLTYLWTIKDFNSLYSKEVDVIATEKFQSSDKPVAAWQLILNIGSRDQENLQIELHHLSIEELSFKIGIKVKISILNGDSEKKHSNTTFEGLSIDGLKWKKQDFIAKAVLMENALDLLPNNSLTIFCEIFQSGYFNTQKECNISSNLDRGLEDYSKFFENSLFSDIIFNVMGTTFEAHRIVITARSPVFWAMLNPENNMKEYEENKIKITDISPEIFKELLRYIYCGKVERMEDIVGDLILAADKYAMDGLKSKCEEEMYCLLCSENAMEFLIVAEKLQIKHLKQRILKFIKSNLSEVIKQKNWDDVFNKNVDLATEILQLQISD